MKVKMKVIKINNKIINKVDIEKKLNITIKKLIYTSGEDFLKVYTNNEIIYLRCEDFKEMFGIRNIFDGTIEIKNNNIITNFNKEIYKGSVNKWKKY